MENLPTMGLGSEFMKIECCRAPLAITAHFCFLGKGLVYENQAASPYQTMKFRFLSCFPIVFFGLFLHVTHAEGQSTTDAVTPMAPDAASNAVGTSAPLQIQDSSVPGATPAPSLFAPEGQGSATPDQAAASNTPVTDLAATNAATNVPIGPNVPAPNDPSAPAPDSGMGSPGQNPPPSDPNSLIPPPMEPEQPSPVNSAGNEERQRQEQKARYYTVKVKADKDEEVASLLEKSEKAKTDEGKRQALRRYYDLLAKRMKKIDSSLSNWIDTMHSAYLRRLEQVRVEPTIPALLPPDASLTASPSPSPSASPHHRKKKVSAEEN